MQQVKNLHLAQQHEVLYIKREVRKEESEVLYAKYFQALKKYGIDITSDYFRILYFPRAYKLIVDEEREAQVKVEIDVPEEVRESLGIPKDKTLYKEDTITDLFYVGKINLRHKENEILQSLDMVPFPRPKIEKRTVKN